MFLKTLRTSRVSKSSTESHRASSPKPTAITARVQPDPKHPDMKLFVVDNVFDRAILISGVGRDQARVIITRKEL